MMHSSALDQESNASSLSAQVFEVPTLVDLQASSEDNPEEEAESDSLTSSTSANDNDNEGRICPLNDTDGCVGDCPYLHGPLCPFCHMHRLNPRTPDQHLVACHSKLYNESRNLECSICLDYIKETNKTFGLQENCNHCFCMRCLNLWRQNRAMANSGACPVCRTPSGFILDFPFWITCQESKKKLMACEKRIPPLEDCWLSFYH